MRSPTHTVICTKGHMCNVFVAVFSARVRWDNRPVDVRAQQDTSEFLIGLNEQLEGECSL
jgi:hypothetical protein